MLLRLGENVTVVQADGIPLVVVTRPCIMGGVAVHTIQSEYDATTIMAWLRRRILRQPNAMAQDTFPNMAPEDREFLMSGITPAHWNKMFPKEEEESK